MNCLKIPPFYVFNHASACLLPDILSSLTLTIFRLSFHSFNAPFFVSELKLQQILLFIPRGRVKFGESGSGSRLQRQSFSPFFWSVDFVTLDRFQGLTHPPPSTRGAVQNCAIYTLTAYPEVVGVAAFDNACQNTTLLGVVKRNISEHPKRPPPCSTFFSFLIKESPAPW